MKVAYVVSDLTYPPTEGLHQQTLLHLKNLQGSGIDVQLYGFVKSMSHLNLEEMQRDLGIRFSSAPIERPGSLLVSAIRNRFFQSRYSSKLRKTVEGESVDLIHCEGIATSAIRWDRMGIPLVLSFIDPGSRRNLRFLKMSRNVVDLTKHALGGLIFFFLERSLRRSGVVWHVVSAEDRAYLKRVHRFARVVDIPVAIPAALERLEVNSPVPTPYEKATEVSVLIYADLRLPHMRLALKSFAENLFQRCALTVDVSYVVLGRVEMDEEMAGWFNGLKVEFIPWANDYAAVIRSCDVIVLPDAVGTGLKNRAIQSMAVGVPVVGTGVAFEGIEVDNGVDAVVLRGPLDNHEKFLRLISDAQYRARIGCAGREKVLSQFGARAICQRWQNLYYELSLDQGDGAASSFIFRGAGGDRR